MTSIELIDVSFSTPDQIITSPKFHTLEARSASPAPTFSLLSKPSHFTPFDNL
jgi:hypothetical protein